ILLGRKLLKKFATRNDASRAALRTSTLCAVNSRCHRHVAVSTLTKKRSVAAASHGIEACRATAHKRPTSILEKSTDSRMMLTEILTASATCLRADDVVIGSPSIGSKRTRHFTTIS